MSNNDNERGGKRSDPHAQREAARYARPIPSREAIMALLEDRGELLKAGPIAAALGLTEPVDLEALDKRLAAMVRDGQLLRNRRDGYGLARKLDLIPGEVLANAEGYGFLHPDDGSEDLYLSPHEMRKVLHGDRILANLVSVDHRGRRKGSIVEVLERRSPRVVGRVETEAGVTTVVPDDERIHQDLLIPPGAQGDAHAGQIVIAEITEYPTAKRGPVARIVRTLGEVLEPSLVVEITIAQHGLPDEWPEEVIAEAGAMPLEVTDAERKGRTDLRQMPLVTIDGEDSRDFDDAVWAEPRAGGGYRLVVAIADVSHYVQPQTALDEEARTRSTSTYFPGFVVPMLPEVLSNGLCSLNPGVDRLCMVCDLDIDASGRTVKRRFYEAVMRSSARLTYNQVWRALGENDAAAQAEIGEDLLPMLRDLHALYKVLDRARRQRGAIEFDSTEVRFALSDDGLVESMGVTERNDAHKLIEECMIAANVAAAHFISEHEIPALYRVHATPPPGKYEDLLEFLRQYKLKLPPADKVQPADYAALLDKVRDEPWFDVIQSVLLRSMSRAVYMPENHGHFGLALDAYAHFTAPIRRYPDTLVHRAIHYIVHKGKPGKYRYSDEEMAQLGVHCSKCERRAEEAERDVDERFKCAWMEKHVGTEFDGVVTGVTSFGLFVELEKSAVSGLVHVTQLPNDYYHFEPKRRRMEGKHSGRLFCLGDRVRVLVLRASMLERKIDFRLVKNYTSHRHDGSGHK